MVMIGGGSSTIIGWALAPVFRILLMGVLTRPQLVMSWEAKLMLEHDATSLWLEVSDAKGSRARFMSV